MAQQEGHARLYGAEAAMTTDRVHDDELVAECICDFSGSCGGLGILMCEGCGGDLCVCCCGGETECFGCDECGEDWFEDER